MSNSQDGHQRNRGKPSPRPTRRPALGPTVCFDPRSLLNTYGNGPLETAHPRAPRSCGRRRRDERRRRREFVLVIGAAAASLVAAGVAPGETLPLRALTLPKPAPTPRARSPPPAAPPPFP